MIEQIKEKALREDVPIIKDDGLIFMLNLIKERNIKDILELGTAVGYSAINMAKLDKDIHIDTLEKNDDMYKQALVNIKNEGLENQIKVHFGAIEEFKTDKKYDLIFVDAAKAQYGRYTEQFLDNLKDDGVFLYDNMIFHGMIYHVDEIKNRGTRALVRKLISFHEKMKKDKRFDIIFHEDVGDGLLVATRRRQVEQNSIAFLGFITAAADYLKDNVADESVEIKTINDIDLDAVKSELDTRLQDRSFDDNHEELFNLGKDYFDEFIKSEKEDLIAEFEDIFNVDFKKANKDHDKDVTKHLMEILLESNTRKPKKVVKEEPQEEATKEEPQEETITETEETKEENIDSQNNTTEDDVDSLDEIIEEETTIEVDDATNEYINIISKAVNGQEDDDLDKMFDEAIDKDEAAPVDEKEMDDLFLEIVNHENNPEEEKEDIEESDFEEAKEVEEEPTEEAEVVDEITFDDTYDGEELYRDRSIEGIYITNPGFDENAQEVSLETDIAALEDVSKDRISETPVEVKPKETKPEVEEAEVEPEENKTEEEPVKEEPQEKVVFETKAEPEEEKSVDDYVSELMDDMIVDEITKDIEEKRAKEEAERKKVYDAIKSVYPYLSTGFINGVYDLRESLGREYPNGIDIIILHRLRFKTVDGLEKFAEVVLAHDYFVNADEKQMIVDTFKEQTNSDGVILNDIFSIANQAKLLTGEYEGYRVIINEKN